MTLVDTLIREPIRALSAYHVPDSRGLIKLDAMENPYRWPEPVVEDWLNELRSAAVNRYPDPAALTLKQRLQSAFGIPVGMEVLLGNGSDELIQIIAQAVATPERTVLAPEPGFVMYRMIAAFTGMNYVGVPLNAADFSLDRQAMLEAIERHQPALIFLAYPNNPTGNLFDDELIGEILHNAPGLVVIDEAYTPFAGVSWMDRLTEFDNLLVMRTVSKLGLAGLRLGFVAGAPQWIGQFDKLRLPYNINVLTQISADFALRHYPVLTEQVDRICEDRAGLTEALMALQGITIYPSAANFILFRTPEGTAGAIFEGLKQRGILIKSLTGGHPLLKDCLRVTVGTPDENRAFVDTLAALL